MDRAWILIGMMGAGKTSVGRQIADVTGREHVDTDRMLVQRLGRPIPQLFRIYGEEAFRDHETSILRGLEPNSSIISTGGGIVLRPTNWDEMRRLGTTIYLHLELDELGERLNLSRKRRPLLEVEDWEGRLAALLELRTPLYQQADITVQASGLDVETCACAVLGALGVKP